MKLTLQHFQQCTSNKELRSLLDIYWDMIFDDDHMTEELANELLQGYQEAAKRIDEANGNPNVYLVIPTYLIINQN